MVERGLMGGDGLLGTIVVGIGETEEGLVVDAEEEEEESRIGSSAFLPSICSCLISSDSSVFSFTSSSFVNTSLSLIHMKSGFPSSTIFALPFS